MRAAVVCPHENHLVPRFLSLQAFFAPFEEIKSTSDLPKGRRRISKENIAENTYRGRLAVNKVISQAPFAIKVSRTVFPSREDRPYLVVNVLYHIFYTALQQLA